MNKSAQYIISVAVLVIIAGGIYFFTTKPISNDRQESQQTTETKKQMSFFITSANPGKGADLGGISGADAYCQTLANSAGAGNRTWRAYLSAQAKDDSAAVNARDRIGNGPWKNFKGIVIANNVEELHSNNNINKETALNEKGEKINGRGDTPNQHDILTGSAMDGRVIQGDADTTCGNWTKSGVEGAAQVGHHDRQGTSDTEAARSWNSSHPSRGCSNEALASSGGGGLIYCFATN